MDNNYLPIYNSSKLQKIALAIAVLAINCAQEPGQTAGDDPSKEEGSLKEAQQEVSAPLGSADVVMVEAERQALLEANEGGELVFLRLRLVEPGLNEQEQIVYELVEGQLSVGQAQRTARPYSYTSSAEPFLYHEEAWTEGLDDRRTLRGYAVRRQPNSPRDAPQQANTDPKPARVDHDVQAWTRSAAPRERR